MPARRSNNNESPLKTVFLEDLISLDWCITDRGGLYVHEYSGEEGAANNAEDTLTRVGAVRQVNWSGVYPIDGRNTSVFKIQVHVSGYDDGSIRTEEQEQWYVLLEDKFVDFSDEQWRKDNLNENERAATNVDKALVDKADTGIGKKGNNGNWLKSWFNVNIGDAVPSATVPNRSQSVTQPTVFGATGVAAEAVDQSSTSTAAPQPTKATTAKSSANKTSNNQTNRGK